MCHSFVDLAWPTDEEKSEFPGPRPSRTAAAQFVVEVAVVLSRLQDTMITRREPRATFGPSNFWEGDPLIFGPPNKRLVISSGSELAISD